MGYILKTTFWLGLVLSAMPLGEPPKMSDVLSPAQQAAACSAASNAILSRAGTAADAYRGLAAMGCASIVAVGGTTLVAATSAVSAKSTTPPEPLRALTENDRKPPWLGPPLPPVRPKAG